MKIIGHRGAAGLAPENSLEAIRRAKEAGVDAIEIDVRPTSDGHFVLSHDASTKRVADQSAEIHSSSLEELAQIKLSNGEALPTLAHALAAAGPTPLFIEVKGSGWAEKLAEALRPHDIATLTVIAIDHQELAKFHEISPDIDTYAIQKFHDASEIFRTFKIAQKTRFIGVDMNFWLLNPLTYWLAKRHNLKVVVYTINHLWIARFMARLFPDIAITTNNPDKLQPLRNRGNKR